MEKTLAELTDGELRGDGSLMIRAATSAGRGGRSHCLPGSSASPRDSQRHPEPRRTNIGSGTKSGVRSVGGTNREEQQRHP